MRIGLYGMPTSGKSYILNQIDFLEHVDGSKGLREQVLNFDALGREGKKQVRREYAMKLAAKPSFIMDGHYAFGDEIAFTEEDGRLYDTFLYLYISPEILAERMSVSKKNKKYLVFDLAEWQNREICELRDYCHKAGKDFYVIDNPPLNYFEGISIVLDFICDIVKGYSCISFAETCADDILDKCKDDTVILLDGDKTLTIEDSSSAVFNYKTHIYDGNFYTGYQAWRQDAEFKNYEFDDLTNMPVQINEKVRSRLLLNNSFIITSGHKRVWSFIASRLGIEYYSGIEMSAETKLYITKLLQNAGKHVVAYGDGMNDYYMLKQADEGYLVTRGDGTISRSLKGRDLEGLYIV